MEINIKEVTYYLREKAKMATSAAMGCDLTDPDRQRYLLVRDLCVTMLGIIEVATAEKNT